MPRLAVLASSVVGYVAIVAAIASPQGVFLYLVNASGAIMLFVYLSIALAQIVLRRRLEAQAPERLTLRMWCFPWLSWVVVAAIAGVLIAMGFDRSLASQLLASLGSLAVVSMAYWIARSRKQRAHAETVDDARGMQRGAFGEPAANWKK